MLCLSHPCHVSQDGVTPSCHVHPPVTPRLFAGPALPHRPRISENVERIYILLHTQIMTNTLPEPSEIQHSGESSHIP